MAKASAFHCTECGWQAPKWVGRCAECQAWGTVVEPSTKTGITNRVRTNMPGAGREARPITELSGDSVGHTPTGIDEFDRVLGGGVVPGAAILLSGEPGVGKSTLLLEVAANAAAKNQRVLYVSAEESLGQVRMRAERTGALHDTLYLASENDLGTVLGQIEAVDPALVVIDSVQTIASDTIDGAAGGPSQVREVAATLIRVAKAKDLPVVLVGHVTKDGQVAGPRLLEHLVDVVCHFEGDRHTNMRFIRTLKNRFGPTDEVGCFEMTQDGIQQVPDPSALFLSRTLSPVSGTCVTIAMEGRRAIPVEVQALVVETSGGNPRRVTSGVDPSRVAMILAVLEKRGGLPIGSKDVFISTVGGVRLSEPAADLAIALAVASATNDRPLAQSITAYGEISLAGEIRPVSAQPLREREATRLGYTELIDSGQEHLGGAVQHAYGLPLRGSRLRHRD